MPTEAKFDKVTSGVVVFLLQWDDKQSLQPKMHFDFIFQITQKYLGWFLHTMRNAEF